MTFTPFPITPNDVVALSVQEFTFDVDLGVEPPLDVICDRFMDDSNRALVWLIRFRALRAWCTQPDMVTSLNGGPWTLNDAWEVAARLELNDQWKFDTPAFCAAIDRQVRRRRARDWDA